MGATGKYQRLGVRYWPKVWGMAALFLALAAVFWWIRQALAPSLFRESFVVVGDPIRVISYDAPRSHFTVLLLPAEGAIEAAAGYGKYPLASLFNLDRLDRRGGRVFTGSIEEGLGLPVAWYMAPQAISPAKDELTRLRSLFSWQTVLAGLTGRLDTNMPFSRLVGLAATLPFLKADQVTTRALEEVFVEEQLADGSSQQILDRDRVDFLLGNTLVDSELRGEGISVTVYNTTATPTLGQRASRLLSRMGMVVVSVGNDTPQLSRCLLSGNKATLSTKTAQFIKIHFNCETKSSAEGGEPADLILRLGGDYESRFLPPGR